MGLLHCFSLGRRIGGVVFKGLLFGVFVGLCSQSWDYVFDLLSVSTGNNCNPSSEKLFKICKHDTIYARITLIIIILVDSMSVSPVQILIANYLEHFFKGTV